MQMVLQLLDHIPILLERQQTSWGTSFLPNITQQSQSNETITKCGNETEVATEEDKSGSWGTPWSINSANTSSPTTRNSHGFFSSCQSSLHLNQHQWKTKEYS